MKHQTLTILGSTGSIGTNTLDVVRAHSDKFSVKVLVAQKNVQKLIAQANEFNPELIVIADDSYYQELKNNLNNSKIEILAGDDAVIHAAQVKTDIVMSAITGANSLRPTMAAIVRGAKVAIANKEALVCAGPLIMAAVQKNKAILIPVDSEHSALFQLFNHHEKEFIDKVIITASGGPFRTFTRDQMQHVTPQQAIKHPNWSMGVKISVDSATLMNKGLELIEAAHLFDLNPNQLDVLVHPQSIVHGIVRFKDGSHILQFAQPDMRIPIAYSLAFPKRLTPPLDLKQPLSLLSDLTFEKPDYKRFPMLKTAIDAMKSGLNAPTLLNAANEIAVNAFIEGKISFLKMHDLIVNVLEYMPQRPLHLIEDVLEEDQKTRRTCLDLLKKHAA
ncbi:MAG: 1-deoxy-D-xylulose-5-phosphate reductoisomerase [Alphaproteobacteria bacterium]|nr:1-deoxy-D-xylulose-5-phosphate reductoisomerase [Alphaproteobacteria bacterium]